MDESDEGERAAALPFEYDREADALYVSFRGDAESAEVVSNLTFEDNRLNGYFVLDLDASGRVVGLEVLGVLEVLPVGFPGPERHERSQK